MDIKVEFGKKRKKSCVLLVDYFECSSPEFLQRFPKDDPYYEIVKPAFEFKDFEGKWKQHLLLYTYGKMPEERILLVGLGDREDISPFKIKVSFGAALKKLQNYNIKRVSTFIDKKAKPEEYREVSEFLAEAAYLSQYQHPAFRSEKNNKKNIIKNIYIILPPDISDDLLKEVEEGIKEGCFIGSVVNEVRDLINKPANYVTPTHLGKLALNLAKKFDTIETKVFDKKEIKKMGMGGLLAVSKGSDESPKFIECVYTPKNVDKYHTIALVGKGITFDSGGISIKPSKGMYRMKDDMAGAALVLGTVKLAAMLNLPIRIMGLVPTCENLLGPEALKPGDIIKAMDGTYVEVYDTDAEGRLILMDGLSYAVKQKAEVIVDLATLTGACTVALGRYVIGGMTNHQPVMDIMRESGDYIYEKVWQLPLMEEYKLSLKSLFADLKNYGGREAGAITAGAFLSHFVKDTPWIHLDIAGVSWFDKETSLIPEGASGIGIRLVIDFLKRLAKREEPEIWQKKGEIIKETIVKEGELPIDHHHPPYTTLIVE